MTPSSQSIALLPFSTVNKERTGKIIFNEKKKIFGKDQDSWNLVDFESHFFDEVDNNDYSILLGLTITQWMKPSITSTGSFINQNGDGELYVTVLPPLAIEILTNSKSINIDVKHKLSNQNENCHHLGISTRLEYFGNYFIDQNLFVADVFVSSLSTDIYRKAFYSILETIYNNGVDLTQFLKNLELIVTDFSIPQYNGISEALINFTWEKKIEIYGLNEKFSGCLFHYKQSALRLKRKMNTRDKNIFQSYIEKIEVMDNKNEIKSELNKLSNSIETTKTWCSWWMKAQPLNLLFNCIQQKEKQTNNEIESLHAHMVPYSTAILSFRESLNRYFEIYEMLVSIINGKQVRDTFSPKRKRY